jgi:hypothetical protein
MPGETGETGGTHRIRSPQNLTAGLALLATAALALWSGADLPSGTLRSMGSGMLPRAAAFLLGFLGLVLVGLGLAKRGAGLDRWPLRPPFFIVLSVVAFALTIRTPGLVVAGPLVAMVGGAASPETRPRELVVFAVVVTAFCVGLFRFLLGLPIPILRVPGLPQI